MQRSLGFLALLFAVSLGATAASADDTQLFGTIVRLERYTDASDFFLQFNGRLFVKNSDGLLDEYRWGGTSCGTKVLTDEEIATLQAAQNNKKMMIQPFTKPGQGNSVCLVGFSLVEKKNLKLFP